jgi:serine/threonine protein kinase/Flp pilus assembly protein TadD
MESKPRYEKGDKIGGRYQVHDFKMGGMGEVYLCLDLKTSEPYALKTFQQRFLGNSKLLKIFENEIATWIAMEKHPNIVRCFSMREFEHQKFIILEWITGDRFYGTDLRSWLRKGPFNLRRTLDFAIDICRGLVHAQEKRPGIVHRDLKPDNILITQGHLAKITDFGLAKIVCSAELEIEDTASEIEGRQSLLSHNGTVGTPPYMAPEQWNNEVDTRTDLYAVGCILYEMLVGHLPIEPQNRTSLAWKKAWKMAHEEYSPPELPRTFPREVNSVIQTCLQKEKDKRFANSNELMQKLISLYEKEFEKPPKIVPTGEDFTVDDYINRAATYFKLERSQDVVADYKAVVALDPGYGDTFRQQLAIPIDLSFSNLSNTNMDRVPLPGACFDHADMRGTALRNANLAWTSLRGTDLTDADLSGTILVGAKYSDETKWPEGFDPELAGAILDNSPESKQIPQEKTISSKFTDELLPPIETSSAEHIEQQRYEHFVEKLNKIIKFNPSDAKALSDRGGVYYKLGHYEEALVDLDLSIELDSNSASTYLNRGLVFQKLQRYEKALADYSCVLQLDTSNYQAYINRGNVYSELDLYEEAIADYQKAIELAPERAEAHLNIGVLLANLGELKKSLPYLSKAEQLGHPLGKEHIKEVKQLLYSATLHQPDSIEAQSHLEQSTRYFNLHQYRKAIAEADIAIKLDSYYAQAYSVLGAAYYELGLYEKALVNLGRAIELDSNSASTYLNRGLVFQRLQRYEEALADYSCVLQLDTINYQAYINRGNVYGRLNRHEEAFVDYQKAIELAPERAEAYLNIGVLLANLGELKKSLPYLSKAEQLGHPLGKEHTRKVKQVLGMTKVNHARKMELAFNAFQKATSLNELRHIVAEFSFMTDTEFIARVEQVIAQQVSPQYRDTFEKRLIWLRQIANEQQRKEDGK